MNLAACSGLSTTSENTTWYRAIQPQFISTALKSSGSRSRFNPGPLRSSPKFDVLYFVEDPQSALFEVQAMLGTPYVPGGAVAHPRRTFTILNVSVLLQRVCDLTDVAAQTVIDMTAQQLTGDWEGYQVRNSLTSVRRPTGVAPTQELGEQLFRDRFEGFRSISAKVPHVKTLMVFPQNMAPGSVLTYYDARNNTVIDRISGR